MIKAELIDKKSICHALIASSSAPDLFIPIKGIVEDVHFHEQFPHYIIKVVKFYDNIHFLKDALVDKPFLLKYKSKPKTFPIPKNIKTASDLENWFSEEAPYRFCVESSFVVRTKGEMVDLFKAIEMYKIAKNLRSLRTVLMRPIFESPMRINSVVEFENQLKRMFGDRLSDDELNQLISSI